MMDLQEVVQGVRLITNRIYCLNCLVKICSAQMNLICIKVQQSAFYLLTNEDLITIIL